jgi:hypothetical protein
VGTWSAHRAASPGKGYGSRLDSDDELWVSSHARTANVVLRFRQSKSHPTKFNVEVWRRPKSCGSLSLSRTPVRFGSTPSIFDQGTSTENWNIESETPVVETVTGLLD